MEGLQQLVHAVVQHPFGAPLFDFIGAGLVIQGEQEVSVEHAVEQLEQNPRGDPESLGLFQPREIERDDGHLRIGLLHGLSQKVDIVGGPAATPGLRDDQRHFVRIVAAALQGVQKLSDDQKGGIAGVIVHTLQPSVLDGLSPVLQQLQMVSVVIQHPDQQLEMDGKHIRHQDGVRRPHRLGEDRTLIRLVQVVLFLFPHRRSQTAVPGGFSFCPGPARRFRFFFPGFSNRSSSVFP